MKILGIVAGRHNGNSEILVKEALLACQEAGAECKLINLFDYNIEHCTGCEACTMQMGDVAMGKLDKYNGCILKSKDDMDKIVQEMYTCNGIIVGVPTYDLTPSSLYLKFAQRFLAYELSFLLEIGAVKVIEGKIVDRFSTFVNPREPIPFEIEQLTSISDEMVIDAPVIEDILPKFLEFCEGCVLIAHNASFDAGFIQENCRLMEIVTDFTVGDTVAMARILLPALNKFKLDTVAKALNISLDHHHRRWTMRPVRQRFL